MESSADDFDFLIPTIMDGSSTGLEGASGGAESFRAVSRRPRPDGGFAVEVYFRSTDIRVYYDEVFFFNGCWVCMCFLYFLFFYLYETFNRLSCALMLLLL